MRLIKMLGLAMVAALAAMAFVGAGSALATSTALCNTHPEGAECKAGTQLSGLQNIDGLQILGVARLLTSLGELRCNNGHIKAHIPSANLATTILGKVNLFSYLECESLLLGCSGRAALVTTIVEPEFHLLYTEANLGTMTILKPSTIVQAHCAFGTIQCKFAENDTVVGTFHNLHEGTANGVIKFSKALITGPGGGLCPAKGELDATFKLNYLNGEAEKPTFIANSVAPAPEHGTTLCSAHPEGSKCKAGTQLSGLLLFDGLQILGVARLLTSLGELRCNNGHIKAHIPNANLATTILGRVSTFTYLECESLLFGCSGRLMLVATTVEPEFHLLYTEANLGTLSILKPATTVKIHCSFGIIECKFSENDTVVGTFHNLHEGKANGIVVFKEAPITGPGGGLCPKTGKLDTTYKLSYLGGGTEKLMFIAS